MKRFWLFTDGSTLTNPGIGGWAFSIRDEAGQHWTGSGFAEKTTTNNRMELQAIIEGLREIPHRAEVLIHTDSAYCMDPFTKGWFKSWRARGWKTSTGTDVLNVDLLLELYEQLQRHEVQWVKVKAHTGVPDNELVDKLARAAANRGALVDPTTGKTFRRIP